MEDFNIKFRSPKISGEIRNIPVSTTFAELQREIKDRTGIAIRHQVILHGFPPNPLTFQVTEEVLKYISKNDIIIVEEKKETTDTTQTVNTEPPKSGKRKKRKSETMTSSSRESKVKTIFDLQYQDIPSQRPKKKTKNEETCITSNLIFAGFIISSFKDDWFLVETVCPSTELINLLPWGIGPLRIYFPSYKVISYSDELKSTYKGEMKKWYVQLKPYHAVDSEGNIGMAQMGLHLHPTPGELVGKSIVIYKKWTNEIVRNDNESAIQKVNLDQFNTLKPLKKRSWEKYFEMPISHMRELLRSFHFDKEGDIQELRSKVKTLIEKKSYKAKNID